MSVKAKELCEQVYRNFSVQHEHYYGKMGGNISSNAYIGITRDFYDKVFTSPNDHTGLVSLEASKKGLKGCDDHFATPQFVARIIFDNFEDFRGVDGEKLFHELFNFCRRTIKVTSEQNRVLSSYTHNKNGEFFLHEGIVGRYLKEDYTILHSEIGVIDTETFLNILNVPDYILDKEKEYILADVA